MSTLNIDTHAPPNPFGLHGATSARRAAPAQPIARQPRNDANDPAIHADGARADALPITGKVYALKDGSGYVALSSDGHYYKLESAGGGLTYASASGPVDAAQVDVAHGPARTMRAATRPLEAARDEVHLPGSGDRHDPVANTANAQPHAATGTPGASSTSANRERTANAPTGSGIDPNSADAAKLATTGSPPRVGSSNAETVARATHGLMARDPDATIRSHARVARRHVASLLR